MFLLFLAIFCTPAISPAHAADNYAEGEALVTIKNKIGTLSAKSLSSTEAKNYIAGVAASASAEAVTTYSELSAAGGEIFILVRSGTKSTEELIAELKKNPDVVSASPNYIMYAAEKKIPNDKLWRSMKNMEMIRAPEAWVVSTGSNKVYIAVLDSGIDVDHEDLKANIDGNLSRNFVNPTGGGDPVEDTDYDEKSRTGHGTHIAGTIAAVGNNGKGVVGVNWNAKLIALRVMDANNATYHSWIVPAIDYIVGLLNNNPEMKIAAANLSIAGWHQWTPEEAKTGALWKALDVLNRMNRTVIVVAAGNENSQVGAPAAIDYPNSEYPGGFAYKKGEYCYPASFIDLGNMIVVGGIHSEGKRAGLTSNWSSERVHLSAPGANVFSTLPKTVAKSGYDLGDGTSRSAPHVAGAAALVAAVSSDLTAGQITNILLKCANSDVNPAAFGSVKIDGREQIISPQFGVKGTTLSKYGLLDVGKAVAMAAGVPDQPDEPTKPSTSGGGGGGCNAGVFGYIAVALALAVLWRIRKINR